ncbi:hypothetical protein Rhom172_1157 [Rhodothermus marinus SG0.5JP17-172]|uniref:hypothetical protein n=1 Tax=Rhodothermus marinus TaxID=29549 RepID=UPI000223DB4C|nr:hypothetical protein [Rhodothermus marinus]AEN73086.1 hypothetical protein Rhom172_1157 [Rhodothermus marinus SG0.5JP17-172]
MNGFVYEGELRAEELEDLRTRLGLSITLSWKLARLDFAAELREGGSAFGPACELRWTRLDGEQFRVLLLCDAPQSDISPLEAVPGTWTQTEEITQLVNLDAPQFAPQFQQYPVVHAPVARLRCRVFYRGGIAMFVSPREVMSDAST